MFLSDSFFPFLKFWWILNIQKLSHNTDLSYPSNSRSICVTKYRVKKRKITAAGHAAKDTCMNFSETFYNLS